MNQAIYTPLQIREVFHLEFLRWFARKLEASRYVLKRGVNLRLFFKSIRYSEDMDIDIKGVRADKIKDMVTDILEARGFSASLKSFGIERIVAPDLTMAKQTETTQLFSATKRVGSATYFGGKIHLWTAAGEDLFIKIEFSRRGLKGSLMVEPVSNEIPRAYKMAPLLVSHYDAASAQDIMIFIRKMGRPVFTTHELTALSGQSSSTVVQSLNRLVKQGLLMKICWGVWAEQGSRTVSPFEIIPYLFARRRVYVSFISALHLHGIVGQIPQVITLASTAHTSTLRTKQVSFPCIRLPQHFLTALTGIKGKGLS